MPCWCQRSEENGQRWYKGNSNSLVTTKICRTPSLNAQHVEPWSRWATAAEDHTGCRSCHQLSIQKSTFGMWWNGRFTSWMCSRQICSNCVILSCQYGPKSQRNVSNTLLNLYHDELRQFWRQKGVQPGTSKVYLIKWPVSVYIIYI